MHRSHVGAQQGDCTASAIKFSECPLSVCLCVCVRAHIVLLLQSFCVLLSFFHEMIFMSSVFGVGYLFYVCAHCSFFLSLFFLFFFFLSSSSLKLCGLNVIV